MRSKLTLAIGMLSLLASMAALAQTKGKAHLNPMVDLLQQRKPVFGIYAPGARNLPGAPAPAPRGEGAGRGNAGGPPLQEDPCSEAVALAKSPKPAPTLTAKEIQDQTMLAKMALGQKMDYLFSGDFEGGAAPVLPRWTEFMKALQANGALIKSPAARLSHPLMLKAPRIGCDLKQSNIDISQELNMGASGLMFPHIQSAKELQSGLASMRFQSKGGTRPDNVGMAAAYWGLSEKEYKERADLASLNPNGELVNFAIIEDKVGLANRREIAAVKGIGVLWPGAGSLGGVFQKKGADGRYVRDDVAWEEAIQQVLAACKEFNVPCGYPANNVADMEKRLKQGFLVFVSGWGDAAFAVVEAGHKAATSNNR